MFGKSTPPVTKIEWATYSRNLFNTIEKSLIIFPKYQQEISTLSVTLQLKVNLTNSEGSIKLDTIKVRFINKKKTRIRDF